MTRTIRYILIGATAAALAISAVAAEARRKDLAEAPAVSRARQLMLKYRLEKIADGTLTASLRRNRDVWRKLPADQRENYRKEARAFFRMPVERQKAMLKHYERIANLPPDKRQAFERRAAWLKVVVPSFTPAQRQELRKLPPAQRARKLLARRDELVRQGKLTLAEPVAAAASAPTSNPAK